MNSDNFKIRVEAALAELGIPRDLVHKKCLPFHPEPMQLVIAETDATGRDHHLIPAAAAAWAEMKQAAARDDVVLELVSAFRNLERQCDIIRAKLARGMPIGTILTLSAPPGYSEHHSGRAIDINTPGCIATEEPFELTDAFAWLQQHAGKFCFNMSYPRGNALGFIYEPWHWCYDARARAVAEHDRSST